MESKKDKLSRKSANGLVGPSSLLGKEVREELLVKRKYMKSKKRNVFIRY